MIFQNLTQLENKELANNNVRFFAASKIPFNVTDNKSVGSILSQKNLDRHIRKCYGTEINKLKTILWLKFRFSLIALLVWKKGSFAASLF